MKLPDKNSLGARPVPQSQGGIVRFETGQVAAAKHKAAGVTGQAEIMKGRALGGIGEAIGQSAQYLAQQQKERDDRNKRIEYVKAKSEFMTKKLRLESEFENDQDYATFDQRYSEALTKIREESMGKISDEYLRNSFTAETDFDMAQGQIQINQKAKAREVDTNLAGFSERTDMYIDSISRATNDSSRTGIIDQFILDADTQRKNGYIDSDEKLNEIKKGFTAQYATNRLLSLPDSEKVEVLKREQKDGGTWAAFIPTGERAKMLDLARDSMNKTEAQAIADGYVNAGLSLEDGMKKAASLTGDMREYVEKRFENAYRINETVKNDQKDDSYNEWYMKIRTGQAGVDDIPSMYLDAEDQDNAFTAGQLENLYSAETNFTNSKVMKHSDQGVLNNLYVLREGGKVTVDGVEYDGWRGARRLLSVNGEKLTRTDYNFWSEATAQAEVPIKVKSFLTEQQIIKGKAEKAGLSDEQIGQLNSSFGEWYADYQQFNEGKLPDEKAIVEATDRFLMMKRGDDLIPFNQTRVYEEDDLYIEDIKQIDGGKAYTKMVNYLNSQLKRLPTDEEVKELYLDSRNSR